MVKGYGKIFSLRETPNLKALKKSKNKKYNKIGDKISTLLSENTTVKYKDEQVEKMCDILNFRCNVLINGDITIRSVCDSWIIVDNDTFFTLYHRGVKGKIGQGEEVYHLQDVFADLEFALISIKSHDEFKMRTAKEYSMSKISELSEKLVESVG